MRMWIARLAAVALAVSSIAAASVERRIVDAAKHADRDGLRALLQELLVPLMDTGGPDSDAIHASAKDNLMRRHT